MTSNMGQLLWSGILPPHRASIVVGHLTSPDMFSDWGIRTTSRTDPAYNPIGYHMGTVWPHDNSLIAYGMARYGYRQEANRVIVAMIEAASHSENRLPEAFSGYERSFGRVPVPYPTACNPQAWASGAPLLFLRTMLGLEVHDGRIEVDADVPPRVRAGPAGRHERVRQALGHRGERPPVLRPPLSLVVPRIRYGTRGASARGPGTHRPRATRHREHGRDDQPSAGLAPGG